MKKIIGLLISVILLILSYIGCSAINELYFDNIYKYNSTEFIISGFYPRDFDEDGFLIGLRHKDKLLNLISDFTKEYNVEIAHSIYQNSDTIAIMSTDTTFGKRLKINIPEEDVIYPKTNINLDTAHTKFILPKDKYSYKIYPIEYLDQLSTGTGNYIINTTDPEIVNALVSRIEEDLGKAVIGESYTTTLLEQSIRYLITDVTPIFTLLILCVILGIFITIKLCVSKSKVIAILHLNGYSNIKIINYFINYLKSSVIFSLVVTFRAELSINGRIV
ncbi:hypothetical protein AN642_02005 [Epulopiscium sp. SCG-B10WGA-EpuloA2]|nr:hypothetical protein AN642_02005 [Epulopiscium sp. SCG-B10WGA-EpuloA2]